MLRKKHIQRLRRNKGMNILVYVFILKNKKKFLIYKLIFFYFTTLKIIYEKQMEEFLKNSP